MAKQKSRGPVTNKASAKKRTLNASGAGKKSGGAPFNEQDTKRRLGNFVGAGEHARQGGGQAGIVGQTRQKNRTDKRG
jgi:hypothetical protein